MASDEELSGMSIGEQRAHFEADLWKLLVRYMSHEFDLDTSNVIMTFEKIKFQIIERISEEEKRLDEESQ